MRGNACLDICYTNCSEDIRDRQIACKKEEFIEKVFSEDGNGRKYYEVVKKLSSPSVKPQWSRWPIFSPVYIGQELMAEKILDYYSSVVEEQPELPWNPGISPGSNHSPSFRWLPS